MQVAVQAITVNGAALHVRSDGPSGAPALVFANSLGTDLRVWEPLLPHLPAGLRLVRYDKRGHGLSDCPEGGWSIETLAAELGRLPGAFLAEIGHGETGLGKIDHV